MAIKDYTDEWLQVKLKTAYVLALEAGDLYIPHDPMEWEGRGRQSVYADMMDLVVELEEECKRRGIDPEAVEHQGELEWEKKHQEWT